MKKCIIVWKNGMTSTFESGGDAFELDMNSMIRRYGVEPHSIGFYLDDVQIGVAFWFKE